jgi:hypothetical protein
MLGTGCLQTQATGGCNVKRYGDNRVKWNVEGSGEDKKKSWAGRTQPGTWKKVSVSLMAKGIAWAGMSQTQATGGCDEYYKVELLGRKS